MRLIKPLILLCLVFSGCGIQRPNTRICVVNAPEGDAKCYNLLKDYDDNGALKSGAVPTYLAAKQVTDLNKFICTDPDGFANLKAYVNQLRQAYSSCQ